MIEELLTWLELISQAVQQSRTVTTKSLSNLVFVAYLLTIRKSYLFGAAFLLCEVLGKADLIPTDLTQPFYGLAFYAIYLLAWLSIAGFHIYQTTNKNVLISCVTMIAFLLVMAMDSYINAYTETFIWRYYASIIVCIHFCIIVSLYWDRFVFTGVVDKLSDLLRFIRGNVYYSYFCYTVKKFTSGY